MKFTNRSRLRGAVPALLFAALHVASGAQAADKSSETVPEKIEATATKVGHAVAHGVEAAASGVQHGAKVTANAIERGAKATASGVSRGVHAAASGVERGAKATGRAVDKAAQKIGVTPAPAASASGG